MRQKCRTTVDGKVNSDLSKKIYNTDELSTIDKAKTTIKETRVKVKPHHEAGMESAAIAATVTCAIPTVDNVTACLDGEITADQAAINIAKISKLLRMEKILLN